MLAAFRGGGNLLVFLSQLAYNSEILSKFAEDNQEAWLTRRARMYGGGLRPPTTKSVDISYIEDNRREI